MKMKADVKKRWVEALRSGRYRQAPGKLTDGKGHCCLGVLCDLARREGVIKWQVGQFNDWRAIAPGDEYGEASVLPPAVQKWAGLDDNNPIIAMTPTDFPAGITAANANDGLGWNFEKIADAIEENL